MIFALISGFIVCVVRKSFFVRFVLNEHLKNGRFVSDSAKIWICGLYESHLKTPHFIKYKQGTLDMVKDLQLIDTNPLIPDMKIK